MIVSFDLKPTEVIDFKHTCDEYVRIYNKYFDTCITRKERDIRGIRIKLLEESELDIRLFNAIPEHCREHKQLLKPIAPIRIFRLKRVRLNYGQFIFNDCTFSFDLQHLTDYSSTNIYTDIKFSLYRDKLLLSIDEDNLEIVDMWKKSIS